MRVTDAVIMVTIVDDEGICLEPPIASSQVVHVPGKRLNLDADYVIGLYNKGQSCSEIAKITGGSHQSIARLLKAHGVTRSRSELSRMNGTVHVAHAVQVAHRAEERAALTNDVVTRYAAGVSGTAIGKALGVSAPRVTRILNDAGIRIRGRSEAGHIRVARDPEAARYGFRVASATNAGRKKSAAQKAKIAASKENALSQNIGRGETQVYNGLSEAGYQVRRQVAVGRYNLDLTVDNIAVEIHTDPHGPHLSRHGRHRRVKDLINAGWQVFYIWCPRGISARDMHQAIAYFETFRSDPPTTGEYTVFRCRGEYQPARGADSYYGAFMVTPSDM